MSEPSITGQLGFDFSGETKNVVQNTNSSSNSSLFSLLSNRFNLLEILSSGFIKPKNHYLKYYPDLGAFCPDSIPLLIQDPSEQLITSILSGNSLSFPVLVDIELPSLPETTKEISGSYAINNLSSKLPEDVIAVVISGFIPSSFIKAIHFRTENELAEVKAREYDNIRQILTPLFVSPARFTSGSIEPDIFQASLKQAAESLPIIKPEIRQLIEGLGGTFLLTAGLVASQPELLPLNTLISPLKLLSLVTSKQTVPSEIPGSIGPDRWLSLLPPALLQDPTYNVNTLKPQNLVKILKAVDGKITGEDDLAEGLLFKTAIQILCQIKPEEFYNQDVLLQITKEFEAGLDLVLPKRSKELREAYRFLLESVKSILSISGSVDRFPSRRSPVATALLHFLLRQEPERVFMLIRDSKRLSPDLVVVSVAFSGALYGRSQIPVDLRPGIAFENHLDRLFAQYIDYSISSKVPLNSFAELANDLALDTINDRILVQDKIILERVVSQAPDILHVDKEESITSLISQERMPSSNKKIIEQPHHKDPILERLLNSELKNTPEKEAALYLCRNQGWNDCISTVLSLQGVKYILNGSEPTEPQLRLQGFVELVPDYQISQERFRKHLTSEFWASLTKSLKQKIEIVLDSSGKGISKDQRKK